MLSCRTARTWILLELDRELDLDRALELDEHVAACSACRAVSRRAAQLDETLLALAEPPVDHVDLERNLHEIRDRIVLQSVPTSERRPWWIHASLAAAVLVLAAGAWLVTTRGRMPSVEPTAVSSSGVGPTPAAEPTTPAAETLGAPDLEQRFDFSRFEAARAALRRELAASALPEHAPRDQVEALATRLDAAAREPALSGWPIERLAAGLFDDGDALVARAALRYLGLRGDRLASIEIERRARTDVEALLARVDARAEASEAVAAACVDERFGELARERLAAWPAAQAAAVLEAALLGVDASEAQRELALQRLATLDEEAIEPLVRLAQSGALRRERAFAALDGIPSAPRVVAALARGSRERFDRNLLIDLVAHLRAPQALAWLDELARDARTRPSGVRGLIAFASPQSFDLLIALGVEGWVDATALDEALREIEPQGDEVTAELAQGVLAHRNEARTAKLLDVLVARASRSTVPALARVAASPTSAVEEREMAIRAVGDFGAPQDVERLVQVFRGLDARDRRLAALCMEAIARLGGPAAVERTLAGAPRRHTERVLDVIERPGPSSVSLVQLARALEPVLEPALRGSIGDNP